MAPARLVQQLAYGYMHVEHIDNIYGTLAAGLCCLCSLGMPDTVGQRLCTL